MLTYLNGEQYSTTAYTKADNCSTDVFQIRIWFSGVFCVSCRAVDEAVLFVQAFYLSVNVMLCILWVEKQDTKLLPITSPNVNRFSNFFFTVELGSKFATNLTFKYSTTP